MKKLILLVLVAAIAVAACKKEKKSTARVDKPIGEAIIGLWITTSESHDYFNTAGDKIFTKTVEPGWEYSINDLFKITNPQGQRLVRTPFTVSNTNGKNYFSYEANGITETFEINSIQQETMTWKQEKVNVTYEDNGQKTAAKEVTTINFHCPCK